jgi:hypothetical protein
MTDSLNPLDDEGFRDISAAAHADDDAPEETLEELEPLGHNGYHPLSGPLAPLGASSKNGRLPGEQRKRRGMLPYILGAVGVIVIVGCLGVGAVVTLNLVSLQGSLNSPQTTLDDFYSALHVNDYDTAYHQLSSGFQGRMTPSSFRAAFELIGTIQSYQITDLDAQSNQAQATVKVQLVKPDGGTTVDETKNVQLVVENGNWKIDRVAPGLT